MARPLTFLTTLRALSSVFLVAAFFLVQFVNICPLGEYRVKSTAVTLDYYLWNFVINTRPGRQFSYSPGHIIACRVFITVGFTATLIAFCVALQGVGALWCGTESTQRIRILLCVSLSLSLAIVMMLVGFLLCFRSFFFSEIIYMYLLELVSLESVTHSTSQLTIKDMATASWKSGVHCGLAAAILCMASFLLDCFILRMTFMIPMAVKDTELEAMPNQQLQTEYAEAQQQGPQLPPPIQAPAESFRLPSQQQQQMWHHQPQQHVEQ